MQTSLCRGVYYLKVKFLSLQPSNAYSCLYFVMRKITLFSLLLATGCIPEVAPEDQIVMGYEPVYSSAATPAIRRLPPQTVKKPGKIYQYGSYLLVNEVNQGIHIFDNADKTQPLAIAFYEIVGNSDMAIKDSVLFADHMGNLVALKTSSNFTSFQSLGSLPIHEWLLGVPPPPGSHFKCVDSKEGLVIDWRSVELINPACYAFQTSW